MDLFYVYVRVVGQARTRLTTGMVISTVPLAKLLDLIVFLLILVVRTCNRHNQGAATLDHLVNIREFFVFSCLLLFDHVALVLRAHVLLLTIIH